MGTTVLNGVTAVIPCHVICFVFTFVKNKYFMGIGNYCLYKNTCVSLTHVSITSSYALLYFGSLVWACCLFPLTWNVRKEAQSLTRLLALYALC